MKSCIREPTALVCRQSPLCFTSHGLFVCVCCCCSLANLLNKIKMNKSHKSWGDENQNEFLKKAWSGAESVSSSTLVPVALVRTQLLTRHYATSWVQFFTCESSPVGPVRPEVQGPVSEASPRLFQLLPRLYRARRFRTLRRCFTTFLIH